MEEKQKFRIKTYLKFLVISPWTEKITLPNFTTLTWVFIVVSIIIKSRLILIISVCLGIFINLVREYKSGVHIHWLRKRRWKNAKVIN